MNDDQFWKNFRLGTELGISGRFIYNGLRSFSEMETLYHEDECFEFLYNLAVGLERLLKVAIILIEHDNAVDQETFEGSLITHNHLQLLARVRVKHPLRLAGIHNEFLQMLCTFYKSQRYGRYNLSSMRATGEEKAALHAFIEKYLQIEISDDQLFPTPNDDRIKEFIGRTTGKIVSELYKVVKSEARRINLFTYEIRHASKASKIFINQEYDFQKEEVLWKELLIHIINSDRTSGHIGHLKRVTPLDFDPELEVDHLQCFASTERMLFVMDELDSLYEEIKGVGERLESVRIIGDPGIQFVDNTIDDSDDEDE